MKVSTGVWICLFLLVLSWGAVGSEKREECQSALSTVVSLTEYRQNSATARTSPSASGAAEVVSFQAVQQDTLPSIKNAKISHFVLLVPLSSIAEFVQRGHLLPELAFLTSVFNNPGYFQFWAQVEEQAPLVFTTDNLVEFHVDARLFQNPMESLIGFTTWSGGWLEPLFHLDELKDDIKVSAMRFYWPHNNKPLPYWAVHSLRVPEGFVKQVRSQLEKSSSQWIRDLAQQIRPMNRARLPSYQSDLDRGVLRGISRPLPQY